MGDSLRRRRVPALNVPHPDSPSGRHFDWSSVGLPHPNSPAGRHFDWSSVGLPHPDSPVGRADFRHQLNTANLGRKIRVLGFDGAKTHNFLFNVALAEVEWQELSTDPGAAVNSIRPADRALGRASMLYDEFLEACSKGPDTAKQFLAQQHELQKKYLQQSLVILQSLQRRETNDQVLLSKVAFAAQVVKSLAAVGIAITGLCLATPEVVAGAGVALGYDLSLEVVKRLDPSVASNADTVVVGFGQTVVNDTVSVLGSKGQVSLDAVRTVLQKTLRYSLKSSVYRSTVATATRLDLLLKTLGGLSTVVTIYTEASDSFHSFERWQKARSSH